MKYSVNPNLNAVMNSIEKQLLSKGKDKQESIQIIKRYIKSFPKENRIITWHNMEVCLFPLMM